MIVYLIKSTIILFILYSFYKLFLEKENMHIFKRFYLLAAVILSFTIPQNKIETTKQPISKTHKSLTKLENISDILPSVILLNYFPENQFKNKELVEEKHLTGTSNNNWTDVIFSVIYFLGFLLFFIKFIKNLCQIHSTIKCNPKIISKRNTKVLLNEKTIPYIFLNFMFLDKLAYQSRSIAPEILTHEQAHIDQKHTLDILFIDVLQIIFWFNPLFHLVKKSIVLNHEFLADQKVIRKNGFIYKYQEILLHFAGFKNQPLTSNINYSLTKKRLKMMTKRTPKIKYISKTLALIPILLALIILFSSNTHLPKNIYIKVKNENEVIINDSIYTKPKNINLVIKKILTKYNANQKKNLIAIIQAPENIDMGFVIDLMEQVYKAGITKRKYRANQKIENTSKNKIVQKNKVFDGASEDMISEYNIFINDLQNKKAININKYKRIVAIYEIMNPIQITRVKKYPDINIPDLSKIQPKTPSEIEFNSWKNKKEFAIWIDGKHFNNDVLDKYKANDFVYYSGSFIHKNARSNKFSQPYQFNLFTQKGFNESYKKYNINTYNFLLKKYIEERNSVIKNPDKNIDETRILYKQLEIIYKKLSKDELKKNNIKAIPTQRE